jgi:hypothetical protein
MIDFHTMNIETILVSIMLKIINNETGSALSIQRAGVFKKQNGHHISRDWSADDKLTEPKNH